MLGTPGTRFWLAFVIAGAGHAAFIGAMVSIKIAAPAAPEYEFEYIETSPDSAPAGATPEGPGSGPVSAVPTDITPPGPNPPPAAPSRPRENQTEKTPLSVPVEKHAAPTSPEIPPVPTPSKPEPASPDPAIASTRPAAATGPTRRIAPRGTAEVPSGGAGTGKAAVTSAGVGLRAPAYRHKVAPDYPERARRLGIEGEVTVGIHISTTGLPTAVDIRKSSGHRLLDEAAREAALDSTYIPARQDDRAVASVAETTIVFRLNQ